MTKNEAIEKVLNIARAEIGYKEKASNNSLDDKTSNAGGANYTKYARDLDAIPNFYNGKKNGYAWCDVFHDWIHVKAWGPELAMQVLCQPENSAGAGCEYSLQYYKNAGRYTKTPAAGHQIFFSGSSSVSHTGIVESVNGNTITTIEGNTSDMVARRIYPITSMNIVGYGIPKYELVCDGNNETTSTNEVKEPIAAKIETVSTATSVQEDDGILRYKDKNDKVKELQENLIKLGYSVGPDGADGEFGKKTLNAVKQFQKDNKLYVDGEVGPDTLNAINAALNKKAATTTTKVETKKLVATSNVNIRHGDSTTYPVITAISKGSEAEPVLDSVGAPIKSANGWYAVRISNRIGWVNGDFISVK